MKKDTKADEIRFQAFLDEELPFEEKEKMEEWLAANPEWLEKKKAYLRLSRASREMGGWMAPGAEEKEKNLQTIMGEIEASQTSFWNWKSILKVAAVFFLCIAFIPQESSLQKVKKEEMDHVEKEGKRDRGKESSKRKTLASVSEIEYSTFDMEGELQKRLQTFKEPTLATEKQIDLPPREKEVLFSEDIERKDFLKSEEKPSSEERNSFDLEDQLTQLLSLEE